MRKGTKARRRRKICLTLFCYPRVMPLVWRNLANELPEGSERDPGPYIGLSKGGFVFFKSPENSRGGSQRSFINSRGGSRRSFINSRGVVGEVLSIPGGGSRFDVFKGGFHQKRGVRSKKGGSIEPLEPPLNTGLRPPKATSQGWGLGKGHRVLCTVAFKFI